VTDRTLVLAIFDNEMAADAAADALRSSGATDTDAIGVLAIDANGKLNEDKVGARSTGKGAGIGAALCLLGPVGVGVGVVGGAAAGALHHKGLKLDGADRARIRSELSNGKAAVGVLARGVDVRSVSERLTRLGGTPESHQVSEDELRASGAEESTT
jgi:uncharacterized membrane protein